jgi:hypothetical protein
MRLYEEIFKNTDGASFTRCTFIPKGGGYFEGVKSVGDFSPERIIVHFPRETVEIEGQNLSIKKYCDGDLQLAGQIFAIKVEHGAV